MSPREGNGDSGLFHIANDQDWTLIDGVLIQLYHSIRHDLDNLREKAPRDPPAPVIAYCCHGSTGRKDQCE